MSLLHAVEMNHIGPLPPLGRHGLANPFEVSYHRLLLVLGTVGLRQWLGPHIRARNDRDSNIGPTQDLRLLERLARGDTGSDGNRYCRQPDTESRDPAPGTRHE